MEPKKPAQSNTLSVPTPSAHSSRHRHSVSENIPLIADSPSRAKSPQPNQPSQNQMSMEFTTDSKYSLTQSGMNCRMISHLSEMVCVLSKSDFVRSLVKNKERIKLELIIECEKPEIYDRYGRTSFFYVSIGSAELPLFQPGTIMFISSVKSTSPMAKFTQDGSTQLNGLILGLEDALFLARFLADLSQEYNTQCAKTGRSWSEGFHSDIYGSSLDNILGLYVEEDEKQYGR